MFTSNPCQKSRARTLQRTSEVAQKLWGAVHTAPPLGGRDSGSAYWIIYQGPNLQKTSLNTLKGLGRGVSKPQLIEKNKLLFTKDTHPQAHACHVIREAVYQQIKQMSSAKIKNRSNCPQPAPVWAAEQAILASVDTELDPLKELWNAGSGTSLVVQWLRHQASTAGDMSSIPGRGTGSHLPHDAAKRKKKRKEIWVRQGLSSLKSRLILWIAQVWELLTAWRPSKESVLSNREHLRAVTSKVSPTQEI